MPAPIPAAASHQPRLGLTERVPSDQLEDLGERMVRFLRTAFALSAVMTAVAILAALMPPHPHMPLRQPPPAWPLVHGAISATLAGMWLWVRTSSRKRAVLNAIDVFGVRAVCIAYALAPLMLDRYPAIENQSLIPVAFVLLLRAAILPSTPARTLLIGLPAILPVPIAAWYLVDVQSMAMQELPRLFPLVLIVMWSSFTILATVMVSKTVFGLEETIRQVRQFGQYVIESKLGEGGMGVVYKARHALLRRPTAVKVLAPDRASAQDIGRFEREVRIASRLAHPNTVAVYDFGRTPDGAFYYAMEYLEGLTLEQLVTRDGAQPPGRVIALLAQVCAALTEAHGQGLVHRDIKPANLMVCHRGGVPDTLKVLDYGLVKTVQAAAGDPELSHTDQVMGTPMYMAPEAVQRPEGLDARADLYAVGAVGWFLLAARPPFSGGSAAEVIGQHLYTPAPSVRAFAASQVPVELDQVLLRCLEKDPARRFQNAAALRDALLRCACEPWSQEDAARWWTEHEASIRAANEAQPTSGSSSPAGATLAIDPRGRAGSS